MGIIKYLKFMFREFLGLDSDYENLLSNQDKILEQLQQLEKFELESQQINYSDYLNLKNLMILLILLGFLGGGFWLLNTDFVNNSILESIKSFDKVSKDLHTINQNGIFDALKKLNENSVNMSKEEIKLLMEIKNLLLQKGINENQSLNKPISNFIQPKIGGKGLTFLTDSDFNN